MYLRHTAAQYIMTDLTQNRTATHREIVTIEMYGSNIIVSDSLYFHRTACCRRVQKARERASERWKPKKHVTLTCLHDTGTYAWYF
jgi:hypothetical protein